MPKKGLLLQCLYKAIHSVFQYHFVHFIQEVARLRLDNSKLKHKLEDYKLILSQPDDPNTDERAMEQLKEHNVRLKRNLTEQVKFDKDIHTCNFYYL